MVNFNLIIDKEKMASPIAPIKPYLKYALELRSQFPLIAYYCKLFFVQKGLSLIKGHEAAKVADAKKFILSTMGELEEDKKDLEGTLSFFSLCYV